MESNLPGGDSSPANNSSFRVDVEKFKRDGFLVFPKLLDHAECTSLKAAIDHVETLKDKVPVLHQPFFDLLVGQKMMRIVGELMEGAQFAFHHMHAECQRAGTKGLGWHHDYEQYPSRDRKHTMIHVFNYLNGLHGAIGDLLLIPGTQTQVFDRYFYSGKGLDEFDNVVVLDRLEPGTIVVVHSAILHARRPKAGGEAIPRYFIDTSFCQAGTRWPPYLENGDWRQILRVLNTQYQARFGHESSMFDCRHFHHKVKDRVIDFFGIRNQVNSVRSYLAGDRHKRLM